MTDIEKAIDHYNYGVKCDIFSEPVTSYAKTAIDALEKQIAKKPKDICTPVVTWGLCPLCKGELNKLGKSPNRVFKGNLYCGDCGQKLDWSDTK